MLSARTRKLKFALLKGHLLSLDLFASGSFTICQPLQPKENDSVCAVAIVDDEVGAKKKKKVQSILTLPRGPARVPSTDAPGLEN